jgi:hypothetical protein
MVELILVVEAVEVLTIVLKLEFGEEWVDQES